MRNAIYSLIVVCGIFGFLSSTSIWKGVGMAFGQGTATPVITPAPQSPNVVTGEATTDVEAARLTGTVNPRGLPTTAWFEYGILCGTYGSTSSTQSVSGSADTEVNIDIKKLSRGIIYYYRIVAQNSEGITHGNEKSFTTRTTPTVVITCSATDVTSSSANLNGAYTGWGSPYFEYGTAKGTYTSSASPNSYGGVQGWTSVKISGLLAATTYYYRLTASEKGQSPIFTTVYTYGDEWSFTTLEATATPISSITPTAIPTPTCEVKSIEVLPKTLKLKSGESDELIVILEGDNCIPQDKTVTATVGKFGSKHISISSTSEVADESGQAKFTITAKETTGKTKVTFKTDNLKKSIVVKVR